MGFPKQVLVGAAAVASISLQGCGSSKTQIPAEDASNFLEKTQIPAEDASNFVEPIETNDQTVVPVEDSIAEKPEEQKPDDDAQHEENQEVGTKVAATEGWKSKLQKLGDVLAENKKIVIGTTAVLGTGAAAFALARSKWGAKTCTPVGPGLTETLLGSTFKHGDVIPLACVAGYQLTVTDVVTAECDANGQMHISACAKPSQVNIQKAMNFLKIPAGIITILGCIALILFFIWQVVRQQEPESKQQESERVLNLRSKETESGSKDDDASSPVRQQDLKPGQQESERQKAVPKTMTPALRVLNLRSKDVFDDGPSSEEGSINVLNDGPSSEEGSNKTESGSEDDDASSPQKHSEVGLTQPPQP